MNDNLGTTSRESFPEEVQQPSKKGGCRGCLRKGCGCAGLTLLICLIVALWPLGLGITPPEAFLYLPSTTMFAYHAVEPTKGTAAPNLSVDFQNWAIGLTQEAGQAPTTLLHLSLDGKLSQAVILAVPSSAKVIEGVAKDPYTTEDFGKFSLHLINNKHSEPKVMGVAAINANTIVAGDPAAIRHVLAVVGDQEDSLLEARPDLRPLLVRFSTSQGVVFTFQPQAIAEGAGTLGWVLSGVNPFFTLLGIRGVAHGSYTDEERCEFTVGYQYHNRIPSTIVWTVLEVVSVSKAIPGMRFPEELGTPIYMSVEHRRGLATSTAGFDVKKCKEFNANAQ